METPRQAVNLILGKGTTQALYWLRKFSIKQQPKKKYDYCSSQLDLYIDQILRYSCKPVRSEMYKQLCWVNLMRGN